MNKAEFAHLSPAAQAAARAIYWADGYTVDFDKLPPGRRALYARRGKAAADAIELLVKAEVEQIVEAALTKQRADLDRWSGHPRT